jgi:hypothetical protein
MKGNKENRRYQFRPPALRHLPATVNPKTFEILLERLAIKNGISFRYSAAIANR